MYVEDESAGMVMKALKHAEAALRQKYAAKYAADDIQKLLDRQTGASSTDVADHVNAQQAVSDESTCARLVSTAIDHAQAGLVEHQCSFERHSSSGPPPQLSHAVAGMCCSSSSE